MPWNASQIDGPISIWPSDIDGGHEEEAAEGYHLNIDPALMASDLGPFRVYPRSPERVWAGDEPPFNQTVFLKFPSEQVARSTSLGRLWIEDEHPASVNSSDWTGVASRAERLVAIRHLLPLAQVAIESMIASLEQSGGNGGPPLDDRLEAADALRHLHSALGEILNALDRGAFNDGLGEGLAAEAVRYGRRAAQALRDDPMPYAFSVLLFSVLSACGFSGAAGLASATAMTITKRARPQGGSGA